MVRRAILGAAILTGCLDPARSPPLPPPTPLAPDAGPRDLGPDLAVQRPSPFACRLVASDRGRLCQDLPTCPISASWQVDCDESIQWFDLAVSPRGQVLAVIETRSGFVLEAGPDRQPAVTELEWGGRLRATFTGEEARQPRLFSTYGIIRPGSPAWQFQLVPFASGLVDVGLTEGEAGFVLLVDGPPEDTVLSLARLPFGGAAPVTVARGAIAYQRLLIRPGSGEPVVVYAERRGPEVRIGQWAAGATTELYRFQPRSREVAFSAGFSATLGADGRPVVLYDDDGSVMLVRDGTTSPVFQAAPWVAPKCERCADGEPGSIMHYNQTDTGERAASVHAVAGPWSAVVTGPAVVFCRAHDCSNEVAMESSLWSLRLRNISAPGPEVVLHRQWTRDPIALEADGAGRIYLAWRSVQTFQVVMLDPGAF